MQRYTVFVQGVRGEKMEVNLCDTEEQFKSMTVLQLKEKICERLQKDVELLRLIFTDKQLDENSRLLCEYGIQHMSDIRVVIKVPGGGGGPLPPDREHGGMGDKDGRNQSMEKLSDFHSCS